MKRKIIMDDIAKQVGVSKNAVSLALRGMPGVSDDMRSLILETAGSAGYKYKSTGDVQEKPVQSICIILSKNIIGLGGFFEYIQAGIESEARNTSLTCTVYWRDSHNEQEEIPLCVRENIVSGIICIGVFEKEYISQLEIFNIPIVMVDHYYDSHLMDCILTDNICGAYEAACHLIEQGHVSIGFVGNISSSPSFFDRWLGYQKALASKGLEYDKRFFLTDAVDAAGMKKLPTAFLCCNDATAIELINVLSRMDLKIPGDISIIGYDDIPISGRMFPELTTVRVNKEFMGAAAVKRLVHKLSFPAESPVKIVIPVELTVRNSVRSIKPD